MSRLLATMGTDLRLQHRNGFYYAVLQAHRGPLPAP